jgi:cation transport ATPase
MSEQPEPVGYTRATEDARKQLDRHWTELMQEIRLAQTGTQILFAFLLAIAFQPRLQEADKFTHDVYLGTLITSAMAVGLFLAPISFHRIVFQQNLRDRLVPITHNLATAALVLLVISMCGGILLAVDAVLSRSAAFVVMTIVLIWFVAFWYALPAWVRRSANRDTGA